MSFYLKSSYLIPDFSTQFYFKSSAGLITKGTCSNTKSLTFETTDTLSINTFNWITAFKY